MFFYEINYLLIPACYTGLLPSPCVVIPPSSALLKPGLREGDNQGHKVYPPPPPRESAPSSYPCVPPTPLWLIAQQSIPTGPHRGPFRVPLIRFLIPQSYIACDHHRANLMCYGELHTPHVHTCTRIPLAPLTPRWRRPRRSWWLPPPRPAPSRQRTRTRPSPRGCAAGRLATGSTRVG